MSAFGNNIKTVLLLGLLTGLTLVIGVMLGGRTGLIIALLFALFMNFFSYWFSDKIALAIYRAKEVSKEEIPLLHNIVEEVIVKAQIPKPKIYIIPSATFNAFATGRSHKHSAVAVTTGILELLSERELKGVIAHELAHIKNRDILISSVAAGLAGIISMIAMMARWGAIFGGFGGNRDGPNILELLVLSIVTPLIAMLIQLAISRSREYVADASGAHFTNDPHALADALEKLHAGIKHRPLPKTAATQSTAHMMIANPFRGVSFMHMLSTHPPMEKRINRLRSM